MTAFHVATHVLMVVRLLGFLGGKYDPSQKLALSRYKPCRTSNQTAINCEMCPVSQVEQSCNLIDEGYTILGWFHSHPSFPPIPSRTDIKTQANLQEQFASNHPFIGFILRFVRTENLWDQRFNWFLFFIFSCVDMEFKWVLTIRVRRPSTWNPWRDFKEIQGNLQEFSWISKKILRFLKKFS